LCRGGFDGSWCKFGRVSYTITNVAYKTFNFPQARVKVAAVEALKRMDMTILAYEKIGVERRIIAAAGELDINIKLEPITSTTTQMKVDVRKWPFLKDKATALEIIYQTNDILDP